MMNKYPKCGGTQMLKQKRQEINVALRVVPDTETICGCRGIISFLTNCLLFTKTIVLRLTAFMGF